MIGTGLASQAHSEAAVAGLGVGLRGSELWVSGNRATNHIPSDPRHVYDWVEITPDKEKLLIGHERAMQVLGVGSLNLKMHSKTD